jgi:hypothetical protein
MAHPASAGLPAYPTPVAFIIPSSYEDDTGRFQKIQHVLAIKVNCHPIVAQGCGQFAWT